MDEFDLEIWKLHQKGYCCSQIMLLLALEAQGLQNPGLVSAMAGLCHGIAQKESACGVFSGGACLLAYAAGKGNDCEQPSDRLPLMLESFGDWFTETVSARYGGISCSSIAGDGEPNLQVCGGLLVQAYQYIRELLAENGLDLEQPRYE